MARAAVGFVHHDVAMALCWDLRRDTSALCCFHENTGGTVIISPSPNLSMHSTSAAQSNSLSPTPHLAGFLPYPAQSAQIVGRLLYMLPWLEMGNALDDVSLKMQTE